MATTYKIHPSIGIARVGTTTIDPTKKITTQGDAFYIAPTSQGGIPIDPATNQPVSEFGPPERIFRDANGNLKKQAARFQIYAYQNENDPGTLVSVGANNIKAIKWSVYLANKKASWYQFTQLSGSGQEGDGGYIADKVALRNPEITGSARNSLILDPGPRTLNGPDQNAQLDLPTPKKLIPNSIETLGAVFTDSESNLLVFGAQGNSGTTNIDPKQYPDYTYATSAYANNEGWFDDVSDGPVNATLILNDGTEVPVTGAWAIVGPPSYAPQIVNMVNLYETMYDAFVRSTEFPDFGSELYDKQARSYKTGYKVDLSYITELLSRPNIYRYVANMPALAVNNHALVSNEARGQLPVSSFPGYILRSPEQKNIPGLMPKLAGDNPLSNDTISKYLTFTATQYFLIKQWLNNSFTTESAGSPGPGYALDMASLSNCVGGPFCPGIEMTWISRNISIYDAPFRIRQTAVIPSKAGQLNWDNGVSGDYTATGVEPGDLSKYMAQPWQTDFNQCSTQPISPSGNNDIPDGINPPILWWWPAQRPLYVFPDSAPNESLEWTRGFYPDPDSTSGTTPNLGDMQMVTNWKDLGFVVLRGSFGSYQEVGRNTAAIEKYFATNPPKKKNPAT